MPDWFGTLFLPSQDLAEKRLAAHFQRHTPPTDWKKEMAGSAEDLYWAAGQASQVAMDIAAAGDSAEQVHTVNGDGETTSRKRKSDADQRPKTPIAHKAMGGLVDAIGGKLIGPPGEKQKATIRFNLGKDLSRGVYDKSIRNMLAHACGSGNVVCQFSGFLECPVGQRTYTTMVFRHGLAAAGADTVGEGYPTGETGNKILYPTVEKDSGLFIGAQKIPGGGTATDPKNPYHYHTDKSTWFAPLNLADYEDMSWNLNRFKMTSPTAYETYPTYDLASPTPNQTGNVAVPYTQAADNTLLEEDMHRKQSTIYTNNSSAGFSAGNVYRYNMVFNKGTVSYNFMNKGDAPLVCNIAVFKVKSNNQTSSRAYKYNDTEILDHIKSALKDGQKAAEEKYPGTDKLSSNPAAYEDFFENPSKPFMPSNRYVKQSDLHYKEYTRQSFALASGDRRFVQFKLGGDIYDPTDDLIKTNQDGTEFTNSVPVVGKHSFIIVISINGIMLTREYGVSTTQNARLGDIYGEANLQWNAEYTEGISACQYKAPVKQLIRVFGREKPFTGANELVSTEAGVQLLSTANATRTPPHLVYVPASGSTPAHLTHKGGSNTASAQANTFSSKPH